MPCYDHEIIEMVAQKSGLDKDYVAHVSEKDIRVFYPATIAHRLIAPHPVMQQPVSVAVAEHELLKKLAAAVNRIASNINQICRRINGTETTWRCSAARRSAMCPPRSGGLTPRLP